MDYLGVFFFGDWRELERFGFEERCEVGLF